MKEVMNDWLDRHAQIAGVIACGVRYPDETLFIRTPPAGFPQESVENALRCVADTFQVLKLNQFPNRQLRWVFQNALLYCVRRGDGTFLGVFTSRDSKAVDLTGLERMVEDFSQVGAPTPP